jgi:Domain of unknown function (DUF4389)
VASHVAYPVMVRAHLDDGLSRWLWLFKWVLAIPHYFVLAFLWIAFVAVSFVAFFAILFTGRYPRTLFDFNVGVLRWTWRVSYYSYGALATDRYPPFTLDDVADYPVHLDVAYPEKLSRGLVLIKWWLLAIPHYLIVGLLMGGTWFAFGDNMKVAGFGLITLLAVIAGVALTFTGRYPGQLFDLLLGFNRWVLRVAAYASLMTDAYPPFRLDVGGDEKTSMTAPSPPATGAGSTQGHPVVTDGGSTGWTAGSVTALVFGCLFALSSLGVGAGGGLALWADATQRVDGFVTSPEVSLDTDAFALVAEEFELHAEGPDWVLPRSILGDARVRITGDGDAVFVGVGRASQVTNYLSGVSYAEIPELAWRDGHDLIGTQGGAPPTPPGQQDFWVASSEGSRAQSLRWPLSNGEWTIVVMNADGSRGVDVVGDVGAEVPVLAPIAVGLLIAAGVLGLIAVGLIVGAISRVKRRSAS